MTVLSGWQNFYVIVGSSAGALIGLQFVVMTLIASRPVVPGQQNARSIFVTPTIVHFGVVVLLSALMNAPWHRVSIAMVLLALLGLAGMTYTSLVGWQMRHLRIYQPELEDWVFYMLLPFIAYVVMAGSSYAALTRTAEALFGVGVAALLLLFIGIHNAWDTVTYHVFDRQPAQSERGES